MTSLISGVAHARLSAPDLGRMRAFLEDFGLIYVDGDKDRLFMRGSGDAPFIHVTERGAPGVAGFSYIAANEAVLRDLVKAGDAAGVEQIDEPGGGKRVRLRDPNGMEIALITGQTPAAPLPPRPKTRDAAGASVTERPARVRRFAHCALTTPDLVKSLDWFQTKLRLIPTDELYVGQEDNTLGRFLRINQGETPQDHHILFVFRGAAAGVHHISFEVESPDEIFVGFNHLDKSGGHDHVRGIGRHALGAQLFDYWMSPFNQMHEHWHSSEHMTEQSAFNRIRIGEGMSYDYGERPPERFVKQSSPLVIA